MGRPVTFLTVLTWARGPPSTMAELILPLPPVDRGTHRSRASPMTPPPPDPSVPMTWSTSARVRSSGWPFRASDPMASTQRGPVPRLGFATPSEGHQPPTTFHVGPTASVTSSPAVTTATGVPIHDPTFAVASTGPAAFLRALSAAAAVGEDVCVRSPPAYNAVTSVASGAGAPITRAPELEVTDAGAPASAVEPAPDVEPERLEGVGASDEHPARATAAAAATHPARTGPRARLPRRFSEVTRPTVDDRFAPSRRPSADHGRYAEGAGDVVSPAPSVGQSLVSGRCRSGRRPGRPGRRAPAARP